MMKKRVLTSVMAIILVISLTIPAVAATYSDLTNHWAKSYMEALATAGYITGYTDGTMKPDKNITYAETLTMLSRLYTLTDIQSEAIEADYGTIAKANVPTTLSWAYKNIEVCLASGIITETELKSVNLTANISKEQLAVYLIRAVQLTSTADALSGVQLTFSDAANVSSSCIGSVAELVTLGVVKGDDKNNFSPKSNVTRAVVATMFSRSLDYIKSKGITLKIADYDGIAKTTGIIVDVNGNVVDICGFDGLTREYTLAAAAKVIVNDAAKNMDTIYEGCYVTITTKNGSITKLNIISDPTIVWVQGAVNSISTMTAGSSVSVIDLSTFNTKGYEISNSATVTIDGTKSAASSIVKGQFITMKIKSGTVLEAYAVTGDKALTGKVTEIKYGANVTFKLADSAGATYCFQFKLASPPTIKRGDASVTVDRVKTGSDISITIDDCSIVKIVISGSETTVSGTITSITTSTNGTAWVIKNASGTSTTYMLDSDATAYSGTTEIPISKVAVGDTVSVAVYNDTIIEVKVESSANAASKVSGVVQLIDSTNSKVTILTSDGKLVYINAASTTVMNVKTGSSMYYSSIPIGSSITAYGTYLDSRNFKATSIIIE